MTQRSPEKQHKREVFRQITLPMVGVLLVMALAVLLPILGVGPVSFSLLSDFMGTVYILLPISLICLLPALGLLAGALALWGYQGKLARPLGRLRATIIRLLGQVKGQAPRAAQPFVMMQGGLSYAGRMLSLRPGPKTQSLQEEEPTHE